MRLHVMALNDAPGSENVKALEHAITGPERIHASGRHLYIDCPEGAGNSKLSIVLIERKLETRGTARNWNTVLKISAIVQS